MERGLAFSKIQSFSSFCITGTQLDKPFHPRQRGGGGDGTGGTEDEAARLPARGDLAVDFPYQCVVAGVLQHADRIEIAEEADAAADAAGFSILGGAVLKELAAPTTQDWMA